MARLLTLHLLSKSFLPFCHIFVFFSISSVSPFPFLGAFKISGTCFTVYTGAKLASKRKQNATKSVRIVKAVASLGCEEA